MAMNEILDFMLNDKDYFEDFITRSVNTSNRIEGSTLSYVETYAILWNDNSFLLNNIKPRDFYEAVNLKYAINHMIDAIVQGEELSEQLIINLNEMICENLFDTKGYRQINTKDAQVTLLAPVEIKHRMMHIIDDFIHNDQIPLMEKVEHFHIMFEHLHPFEYGNGKTSRLLINFALLKEGMAPVVIPDEKRIEYFKMISEYQTEELAKMLAELQKEEFERIKIFQEMAHTDKQCMEL